VTGVEGSPVFDQGRAKGGLGRGLGALIPSGAGGVAEVEVSKVVPNPRQPRQQMNPEELRELADSVRAHGLLQPVVVTRVQGEEGELYQLIAGERRLAAARLAGLTRIPVVFREATPEESLELALVENLQRADLNPLEAATAYQRLIDEFGLSQEQVAARVGKSRPTVANTLRLLGLPEDVKAALSRGEISEGHARALLGLPEESERVSTLREVVQGKLSVRSTEELVRRRAEERERREASQGVQDEIRAIEDAFRTALGTRVSLVRRGEGGQLVIYFYSEEQLQALYDLLVKQ
jgi:ParB family chromosome partitioning protein